MVTVLPAVNPPPLIVTAVPPVVAPLAGMIPLIVGGVGALIVNVTGMLWGLLLAVVAVTLIVVVYVPRASPATLAETETGEGAVPLPGVKDNQGAFGVGGPVQRSAPTIAYVRV